jgi:hypothetical protein
MRRNLMGSGGLRRKAALAGLVVLSTALALLLAERVLRLVVNPGDFLIASLIDDPVLGHRIQPGTTGHDELGFRNARLPERADIIALGDSMTYGVGVAREQSWPHQLGVLLQQPVYNMGLGGFGPLHQLYLAEHEGKKLRPRVLLAGLYLGNDLMDARGAARQLPYWRAWREPGPVDEAEDSSARVLQAEPKKRFAAVRNWLSRNSVFYSMLRLTLLQPLGRWEEERIALAVPPERRMLWKDPRDASIRTVFTPLLRLSALDPELAAVREGLGISKRALDALQAAAHAQGAGLLVVLIPTKERVYCAHLEAAGTRMPEAFVKLCSAEEWVTRDLARFLDERRIAYVDVRPALEREAGKRARIYPNDADSHPLAAGYAVIAGAVHQALLRHGLERAARRP